MENVLGRRRRRRRPTCRRCMETNEQDRQAADDARGDGAAPRQPGVRELSCADGPARLRARELRCRRPLADPSGRTRRSTRPACCRTARSSTASRGSGRRASCRSRGEFAATLTERLLTYALGRGVEYYDAPAVRAVRREAAAQQLSASAPDRHGIVKSVPFQMRGASSAAAPSRAEIRGHPRGERASRPASGRGDD